MQTLQSMAMKTRVAFEGIKATENYFPGNGTAMCQSMIESGYYAYKEVRRVESAPCILKKGTGTMYRSHTWLPYASYRLKSI